MARLLDEYPDVFDAYWAASVGAPKGGSRASFKDRREETRAKRMRKAASRR